MKHNTLDIDEQISQRSRKDSVEAESNGKKLEKKEKLRTLFAQIIAHWTPFNSFIKLNMFGYGIKTNIALYQFTCAKNAEKTSYVIYESPQCKKV